MDNEDNRAGKQTEDQEASVHPLLAGDDTAQPSPSTQGNEPAASSVQTISTVDEVPNDLRALSDRMWNTANVNAEFRYAAWRCRPARMHAVLIGPDRDLIEPDSAYYGYTALLSLASSTYHQDRATPTAKELLETCNVNVNFQEPMTLYTPLHMAASTNNADLCRLLLLHGADPELKEAETGMTPLELAEHDECEDAIVAIREYQNTSDAVAVPALLQDKLDG